MPDFSADEFAGDRLPGLVNARAISAAACGLVAAALLLAGGVLAAASYAVQAGWLP